MRLLLQVADAAKRLGVTPTTVRLLERCGKLQPAARTPRGVRLFDPEV
jgi:DNA-binding transcriptional MerR regulator